MNRVRLSLAMLTVCTAAFLAGCGSAAVTSSPAASGPASSTPGGSATTSVPPVSTLAPSLGPAVETEPPASAEPPGASEAPGSTEIPTDLPGESPAVSHLAPDLEALLPSQVNGTALTAESETGAAILDAWTQVMVGFLNKVGKTPADLELAQAYDPASGLDVSAMAFR